MLSGYDDIGNLDACELISLKSKGICLRLMDCVFLNIALNIA